VDSGHPGEGVDRAHHGDEEQLWLDVVADAALGGALADGVEEIARRALDHRLQPLDGLVGQRQVGLFGAQEPGDARVGTEKANSVAGQVE
jgi:hypothetical protein